MQEFLRLKILTNRLLEKGYCLVNSNEYMIFQEMIDYFIQLQESRNTLVLDKYLKEPKSSATRYVW